MRGLSTANWKDPRLVQYALAGPCLILLLWCWLGHRSLRTARSTHVSLVAQIEQMRADAQRIELLRTAPRIASERARPNDELLAQVRNALEAAQIPLDKWIGNEPDPAVRVPQSAYKRIGTRLSFEDVDLKSLVTFIHCMLSADPSLSITRMRLTAPSDTDTNFWDADLAISYLIYSPTRGT
jgi:hypothetical protein